MSSTSWQTRTELLIGKEKLSALRNKHVLVAGLGGVGAVVAEQLAGRDRKLTIVDGDTVHSQ
jgi:tRNA A37 threonylcarbamoyladenosine dehydratase